MEVGLCLNDIPRVRDVEFHWDLHGLCALSEYVTPALRTHVRRVTSAKHGTTDKSDISSHEEPKEKKKTNQIIL